MHMVTSHFGSLFQRLWQKVSAGRQVGSCLCAGWWGEVVGRATHCWRIPGRGITEPGFLVQQLQNGMWHQHPTLMASYTEYLCSPYGKGQVYWIPTAKYQLSQKLQGTGLELWVDKLLVSWLENVRNADSHPTSDWQAGCMFLGAGDCRACVRVHENVFSASLLWFPFRVGCLYLHLILTITPLKGVSPSIQVQVYHEIILSKHVLSDEKYFWRYDLVSTRWIVT